MDDKTYNKFVKAKKTKNLSLMKTLYNENPFDYQIKYGYANLLLNKNRIQAGKKLLLSLLNTSNSNYAILRLGKLEKELGNLEEAQQYFRKLFNTKSEHLAIFELAKIEKENGNIESARILLKNLLTASNKEYAILELGTLEKENKNIDLARFYFTQLLTSKINNYGLSELGRLEYEEGNVDLARKYFYELLNTDDKEYAISLLLVLEISEKNYIDAYNYIIYAQKNNILVRGKFLVFIEKVLNVKLNINYDKIDINNTIRQIINYDESLVIKEVCEKHSIEDIKLEDSANLGTLYSNAKAMLIPRYKKRILVFNDVYEIPYKVLGFDEEEELCVITLPNSNNIITMYTKKNNLNIYKEESVKVLKK